MLGLVKDRLWLTKLQRVIFDGVIQVEVWHALDPAHKLVLGNIRVFESTLDLGQALLEEVCAEHRVLREWGCVFCLREIQHGFAEFLLVIAL